jgi:hypothetical protein
MRRRSKKEHKMGKEIQIMEKRVLETLLSKLTFKQPQKFRVKNYFCGLMECNQLSFNSMVVFKKFFFLHKNKNGEQKAKKRS